MITTRVAPTFLYYGAIALCYAAPLYAVPITCTWETETGTVHANLETRDLTSRKVDLPKLGCYMLFDGAGGAGVALECPDKPEIWGYCVSDLNPNFRGPFKLGEQPPEGATQGQKNRSVSEEFLRKNALEPGVVTLPSGLQYRIIKNGVGSKPRATDSVTVHYRATLFDGTEFDNSYKNNRGKPAKFRLDQVIKGWSEALQLMPQGSKWQLFIPASLAYGERGAGPIGPNSALVFDVELIKIEPELKEISKFVGVWSLVQKSSAKKYSESYIYIKHLSGKDFGFGTAYPITGEQVTARSFENSIFLVNSKGKDLNQPYVVLKLLNDKLVGGFYALNYWATHAQPHSIYLEMSVNGAGRLLLKEYGFIGLTSNMKRLPFSEEREYESTNMLKQPN